MRMALNVLLLIFNWTQRGLGTVSLVSAPDLPAQERDDERGDLVLLPKQVLVQSEQKSGRGLMNYTKPSHTIIQPNV